MFVYNKTVNIIIDITLRFLIIFEHFNVFLLILPLQSNSHYCIYLFEFFPQGGRMGSKYVRDLKLALFYLIVVQLF